MTFVATEWSQPKEGEYLAKLPGGWFELAMHNEDLPFQELCDLAIRNNAKRRFLFVSRVLGRHIPVRPSHLSGVAGKLAGKLRSRLRDEPTVFIGMAETATTLGQDVFRQYLKLGGSGLYIESTRRTTGGERAFEFSECHSHATAHVIHRPSPEEDPSDWLRTARQVVVVDDEATTASTAAGLLHAMRAWRGDDGIPFDGWLAVILRWNQGGESDRAFTGVESLAEGTFTFHPVGELPEPPASNDRVDSLVTAPRGIRHGGTGPQSLPPDWATAATQGEKILVLGNGELGFRPLVLAERFEDQGALAWVQATTRSPIWPGGAIGHIREFAALSGEGYREFLYNVPDDHGYDRVVLCLEDPQPERSHPIFSIPRLEVRS